MAFDTIELNRHFDSDNTNIHTFIPFHGTPLRKLCEQLGFIKPETITKCVTHDETSLDMPQYPPHEIKEIRKIAAAHRHFRSVNVAGWGQEGIRDFILIRFSNKNGHFIIS